jgi:carboxyl-terminal processing protease
MAVYRTFIDDQIRSSSFELLDLSRKLFDQRVSMVQGFYRDLLSHPFDFSETDSLETDAGKQDWAPDDEALRERWKKKLKYQVMSRVYDNAKLQEAVASRNDTVTLKTFAELEAGARKSILKTHDDWFRRLGKIDDTQRFGIYINSILRVFDPHTQYLPPADRDNFDISMSGQLEGIGASLQEDEGYARIVSMVPGSPSWLQGELKVNDLIMKVRQEDQAEAVDILGMSLDEAVKLIRGKKGTRVTLTVKSSDGVIKEVTLVRDVVVMEESYARSSILRDSLSGRKYGYIYLPKFYVDFNNTPTGRSCAEDMAVEIQKLKQEGVEGLVLDLRDNTGGSLPDAIRVAGLFIGSGPVVQVKSRMGSPSVQSDPDPAVQYEGPMVVLVNALSASASEIVAAALQDYGRAVIVGGKATFGKGTVQTVLDMDEMMPREYRDKGPFGSLMLTIQKFYRINGGATQQRGVIPDVQLPDPYDEMEIGERDEDFSLPWSEIRSAQYQPVARKIPLERIQKEALQNMERDSGFIALRQQADFLRRQRQSTMVSLKYSDFEREEKARGEAIARFERYTRRVTGLQATALPMDLRLMGSDTAKLERSRRWVEDLRKDLPLAQAVSILKAVQ